MFTSIGKWRRDEHSVFSDASDFSHDFKKATMFALLENFPHIFLLFLFQLWNFQKPVIFIAKFSEDVMRGWCVCAHINIVPRKLLH